MQFEMKAFTKPELESRRGSVLLLCLGVLALLSLLGTALIFMVKSESKSSKEYVDKTRAEFAAESGLETAIAKLSNFPGSLHQIPEFIRYSPAKAATPIEYTIESSFGSLDTDGDGKNDAAGNVSSTYKDKGDFYRLRVESCQSKLNINDTNSPMNIDTDPYEDQLTPERDYSAIPKHMQHPNGKDPDWAYGPAPFSGEDPDVNLDGWVNGDDLQTIQDVKNNLITNPILVKRADLLPSQGVINIADIQHAIIWGQSGFDPSRSPDGKPHVKGPRRLEIIVESLLNILIPGAPFAGSKTTRAKMTAQSLFRARRALPNDRFDTMNQVRDAIVKDGLLTTAEYEVFESYITLSSWQNPNVLRPTFQWRISTPPLLDTNDPLSAHVKYFPGDYGQELNFFGIIGGNTVEPRPQFDSSNQKDVYMYSDMQTKHFDLGSRCPIDINSAPKELIQALIAPLRGWYLKEAPNAGEAPRAEDWSQGHTVSYPSVNGIYIPILGCPSYFGDRVIVGDLTPLGNPSQGFIGFGWNITSPDINQYYYYDELRKNFLLYSPSAPNTLETLYARKSARFGELMEAGPLSVSANPGFVLAAPIIANKIYARIHGNPDDPNDDNPFETWEEFEDYIRDLVDRDDPADPNFVPTVFQYNHYMADALIANFNPNSRINDYNPNSTIYLNVDKSQLIVNTTEFCFHSMGYFRIESLGSVLDGAGKTASSERIGAQVKIHEAFQVTSQADYLRGYSSLNGELSQFFSDSNAIVPTAGSSSSHSQGFSLQSYPEPDFATRNYIQESVYDGWLAPALLQPLSISYFYEVPSARFLADFNRTLDATFSGGDGIFPAPSSMLEKWKQLNGVSAFYDPSGTLWVEPRLQAPSDFPDARKLTGSADEYLFKTSECERTPGILYPDGAYSDTGRGLKFISKNNLGEPADPIRGRRGAIQFWIKPNFNVAHSNRIRNFFCTEAKFSNYYGSSMQKGGLNLRYFARGGSRVPVDSSTGSPSDTIFMSYDYDADLTAGGQWLPTRACFLQVGHTGSAHFRTGTGTSSLNQSWRTPAALASSINDFHFNLESHQWSNVSIAWDLAYTPPPPTYGVPMPDYPFPPANHDYVRFAVNGRFIDGRTEGEDYMHLYGPSEEFYTAKMAYPYSGSYPNYVYDYEGPPNYMRFGESSDAEFLNDSADSTFDDIVSSSTYQAQSELVSEFLYGRYYSENDAVYSSPKFSLHSELDLNEEKLSLHSIEWTVYVPKQANPNYTPDHPRWNDNLDGNNSNTYLNYSGVLKAQDALGNFTDPFPADPMYVNNIWNQAWVPVSVDVFDPAAGAWFYEETLSTPKEQMPNYGGGSMDPLWLKNPLRWGKGDSFQFRVHFNQDPGVTAMTAPILDDMTFIFTLSSAKILYWEKE